MRTMFRVLLGSAMLIGCVAATMPEGRAAADGKRIAVFMGPTQDKYLGAMSTASRPTPPATGMKVTVFSSPFDPALQSQQIDDAIAQKFDLLVVQTISQNAIIPLLTRGQERQHSGGADVVPMVGNEANQDLYLSHVGYDDEGFGRSSASDGEGAEDGGRTTAKIASLAGCMAEGKAPMREKAFREAIAKTPASRSSSPRT